MSLNFMIPSDNLLTPIIDFKRVVFPAPFLPIRAIISPFLIFKVKFFKARIAPILTLTPFTSNIITLPSLEFCQ